MIIQPPFTKLPQPKLQFLSGDYALVVDNYRIEIPSLMAILDISKGFWFDGASKPSLLWNIPFVGTPWDADCLPAATVHDFLCKSRLVKREDADKIWRELLLLNGVSRVKAAAFYEAVRLGALAGIGKPTEDEVMWARTLGGIQSKDENIDAELAITAFNLRPTC